MSVRENQLIDFISDSDKYERLLSFEDQMKYQTEIISSFFNQQNITDNTGKDNKLNIFETQSMTNLTSDDECNPFLIFMKTKTDKLSKDQLSKSEAMFVWSDYKRTLNKIIPILISHFKSRTCNMRVVLEVISDFLDSSSSSLTSKMNQVDSCANFLVEYMEHYYSIDTMMKDVDLKVIFKFCSYQKILSNQKIVFRINQTITSENELYLKNFNSKIGEVVSGVLSLDKVKKYYEKLTSKEKAERLAVFNEKKSNIRVIPDLLLKSQKRGKRKIDDVYLSDMLQLSRESSRTNQILINGINVSFRDCPYVVLINLSDLEARFMYQLENKELEMFKTTLQMTISDLYGSTSLVQHFFGKGVIEKKLPILTRIVQVLRNEFIDNKMNTTD